MVPILVESSYFMYSWSEVNRFAIRKRQLSSSCKWEIEKGWWQTHDAFDAFDVKKRELQRFSQLHYSIISLITGLSSQELRMRSANRDGKNYWLVMNLPTEDMAPYRYEIGRATLDGATVRKGSVRVMLNSLLAIINVLGVFGSNPTCYRPPRDTLGTTLRLTPFTIAEVITWSLSQYCLDEDHDQGHQNSLFILIFLSLDLVRSMCRCTIHNPPSFPPNY